MRVLPYFPVENIRNSLVITVALRLTIFLDDTDFFDLLAVLFLFFIYKILLFE
jgi:hypothetical protein